MRTELTIAYIFYGSKAVIGIPKMEYRNVLWEEIREILGFTTSLKMGGQWLLTSG